MATNPGLKKDSAVVSEKSSGTLRKIQIKYSEDYRPFLAELIKRLGKKNSEQLVALKELVESVIQDLGKLSSGVLQSRTQSKFLKQVTNNIDLIESGLKSYRDSAKASDKSSEAIKKVEQKTDISFEGLLEDQKGIKESMKKTTPKGPGMMEKLKGIAPEPFATGKDIGMGLAQATLGPFAGMATMAGKAGVSVAKALRDKMIARKEKKVSEALRPMSTGISKDVLEELAQLEKTGHPVAGVFKPGSMAGAHATPALEHAETVGTRARPAATARVASVRSRQAGGAVPMGGREPNSKEIARAAKPIEYFFDKLADKAKWTHEVLKELKKISQGAGGGLLGGLMGGGLMGAIKSALPFLLGTIVPVVLGMVALTAAGLWMEKMIKKMIPKDMHKYMDLFSMREWAKDWKKQMFTIREAALGAFGKVGDVFKDATKGFSDVFGKVKDIVMGALKPVFSIAKEIHSFFAGPIKKIGDQLTKSLATLRDLLDPVKEIGKQLTERFTGFFDKFKWAFPKAAAATTVVKPSGAVATPREAVRSNAPTKGEIAPQGSMVNALEKLVERIEEAIGKMNKSQGAAAPGPSAMGKTSNDDVYNTRDPLLGSLNSGSLHLSG